MDGCAENGTSVSRFSCDRIYAWGSFVLRHTGALNRGKRNRMKYKRLGRTGLFVSELCLGTMTLGGNEDAGMWKAIGTLGQNEADALIGHALAAGINFIDTADVYS